MDSTNFDRWTRTLSHRLTRRHVLAFAPVGGILAALGVGPGSDGVMARKKKKKKKKTKPPSTPAPTFCQTSCLSGCCPADRTSCFSGTSPEFCGGGGQVCENCGGGRDCKNQRCCRALGDTCTTSVDCCNTDAAGSHVCEQARCCRPLDQRCTESSECCPRMTCGRRSGDSTTRNRCLGTLGAECQIIEQCADGLVCRYGHCCRHTRASCTQDSDCCEAGDVCEFRNDLGRNACCREAGETCSVDQDCCGAMECRGELPQRCVPVE